MLAGRGMAGVFPKGVLGLVTDAALVRVYCVKPPPAIDANSDVPAARMTVGAGGTGTGMGVLLNEGKIEKAGVPAPEGAPSVGGPVKLTAEPPASKALPWGIEPMRATICPPEGGFSGGSVVGLCVTQMPGSI